VHRSVEVRILGPIEVLVDERVVELGAGNERALIGFLALHPNRPVSTEAIIDAVWGERPPPTAREMVRTYVARARKRLGDVLQRRSGGYVLQVPADAVDAFRFERLLNEGLRQRDEADPAAAAFTLRQALALWRGAPLPELQSLPGANDDIARLGELRLSAIEARVEQELVLGHGAELVPELDALVREYPYRERLRADLMVVLYRTGRQTEALEQYLEARRLLVEEIGIEPGRELQELQAAILRQDPALEPPSRSSTTSPAPAPTRVAGSRLSGRRRFGVAGAAIILTAAAILIVVAMLAGEPSAAPALGRRTVAVINPADGSVIGSRQVSGEPGPIAVGRGVAWVADGANDAIVAMSPTTLHVRRTVRLGTFPYQLATDGIRVWLGDGFDGTVTRVDPSGVATTPFLPEPRSRGRLALAYGAGAVWIGSQDGSLSELDPSDDHTIAVAHGIGEPQALTVAGGAVWIAEATSDEVLRFMTARPRTRKPIPIGGMPDDLAVGDGSVWAVTSDQGLLWRIDEQTGAVTASIDVGPGFSLVALVAGQVWVASPAGTVERVDPRRDVVAQTLDLDGPIGGLAAGDRQLWISIR
jgi:DNA-binding SARP family transcriptional activator/streptogramin lyase